MKNKRIAVSLVSCTFVAWYAAGCASTPEPIGFLSDYSRLEKMGKTRMSYAAPRLREYGAFMIDPVEYRLQREKPKLNDEQKAEIANYFRESFERALGEKNCKIVNKPGKGVARLRAAFTDIKKSKWYLNLHPSSKLSGSAVGGASMEAEIVDSVTGEQLAGIIVAGKGNQFELDHFKALDDVEDVIDRWAKILGNRVEELRDQASQ